MRTSKYLRFLFLLTIILCIPSQAQQRRRVPRTTFTTDTPMLHDPVMAYEDSTYYIFATGMGIQQMTSKDRQTWTVLPTPVMSVIPTWAHDSVPGFRNHVWAPDIIKWHGKWWLAYSCSTFGKNGSAIGLLSNRSLSFPIWEDEGCIVSSQAKRDNWNAIDPNFVIDENDQPWLTWCSFWDGIQIVRLDSTMHIPAGEKPRTIARRYNVSNTGAEGDPNLPKNPTSQYAGQNAIEAPFIFKHGDYYYLFVSWDYCCQGSKSTYRVAVGRSKKVDGPYLDREGRDMREGGGVPFIEGDKKTFDAVGHCAVYHFNGEDIFISHGYSIAHEGASVLVQKTIRWTEDGWPQL